jgi:Domain of unknown function (DUF1841)
MFQPRQADVRRFFCAVYRKWQQGTPVDAMEALALPWIQDHPEYHAELADEAQALERIHDGADGGSNPFLHLAMHLTIAEQDSIDQPGGIRQALALLAARRGSLHEAHHEVMECLGRMLWESQRSGRPPDGLAYIEAVRARATRG